jgi:hypothetical protein
MSAAISAFGESLSNVAIVLQLMALLVEIVFDNSDNRFPTGHEEGEPLE